MTQDTMAERAEQSRDLRNQISELRGRDDEQEIIFRDVSPRRTKVTLYSMITGEAVEIPRYMAERVLDRREPDGKYSFTSNKASAPEFREGQVKCFMHPESTEAEILRTELGILPICNAAHLSNSQSKRLHAMHRHPQSWAAYQEWLQEQKDATSENQNRMQLEATLAIARAAGGQVNSGTTDFTCEVCGKGAASAFGLQSHMRSHKETS